MRGTITDRLVCRRKGGVAAFLALLLFLMGGVYEEWHQVEEHFLAPTQRYVAVAMDSPPTAQVPDDDGHDPHPAMDHRDPEIRPRGQRLSSRPDLAQVSPVHSPPVPRAVLTGVRVAPDPQPVHCAIRWRAIPTRGPPAA